GGAEVLSTARKILRMPDLRRFLGAYFIYEDGVNTVVGFSAIFAAQTLGFPMGQLIVLYIVVQVSALLGALAWAWPTDKLGPKRVVMVTLCQWTAVVIAAYFVETQGQFWALAVLAGTGLGAVQAASRAFLAGLCPQGLQGRAERLVAPPDDAEPPDQGRGERNDPQRARARLGPDGDRGGDGGPEPRADELLDGLAIPQLHGHARRHPAAPEPSLDDLADGASPLGEDEGLARQVPGREGAGAAPAARGGGDGDQAVRVEGRHHELSRADGKRDHGDVEGVLGHCLGDLRRVARHDDELEVGIARAKAPQDRREEVDAGRGAGAHADPPGHHPPKRPPPGRCRLQGVEGPPAVLQEDRPRPGERGPPAHALEEGQPQAVLELAHVEADGGLAQVERVR